MLPTSKQSNYGTRPAVIHAYVDCPNCGRIPKPSRPLLVRQGVDSPDRVHSRIQCDRCGSDAAMLYLEREMKLFN